jgi:hypothetical protein
MDFADVSLVALRVFRESPHLVVSDSVIWLSFGVRWARFVAGAEQRRPFRCQ